MSDILDDYEDAMFDRGKIVEHIPLARLRELATAQSSAGTGGNGEQDGSRK